MKRFSHGQLHTDAGSDRGSTLITVIVAIAFVTILVTIILGTTAVNVRMKGIDRRTKDDFYNSEKALNDIYTGLGQEMAAIAGDEYDKAFKKVGLTDDYSQAEVAETNFRKNYIVAAHDFIDKLDGTVDNKVKKDNLKAYVIDSTPPKVAIEKDVVIEYQTKTGATTTDTDKAVRVVLKDVEVSYTDSKNFRSTVSTDIVISIPTVDFLGTNADVSDYGLIANKGLYIYGTGNEITGNVYAGVHPTPIPSVDDVFSEKNDDKSRNGISGGINIQGDATFKGNYIVSKGDINLSRVSGKDTKLKVLTPNLSDEANLTNLWFTSLRTIKGDNPDSYTEKFDIDIDANVFALNDLALNANNSNVKIKGNYYGYNDKTLLDVLGVSDTAKREDGVSSAIIINGSNASLDMREIENLVLMGKAYIDFTTDLGTTAWDTAQVVPTAESVALKTNQQLYLVPPDFLKTANPVEGGTGTFDINISNADLQNWFGYKYLDTSSVPSSIHKSYKVTVGSGVTATNIYYDYLKFYDDPVNHVSWEPKKVTSLGSDTADKVYTVTKTPAGAFEIYEYKKINDEIGTHGSISSQAMFFLKIMTARSTYEYAYNNGGKDEDGGYATLGSYIEAKENTLIQPSAYRLYERINRSMGYEYFDLSECVVGDSAAVNNAHYYAKNAVINYERVTDSEYPSEGHPSPTMIRSNVLNNTEGMLRYAGYPQNLYNRYKWLCTRLDGKEKMLLEDTLDEPQDDLGNKEWKIDTTTPFSHFVKNPTGYIGSMTIADSINNSGLNSNAYGVCVATTGNLTLSSVVGETFKGVAIVDGNITVPANLKVDGLLLATGTITLMGNNEINYNKGLIQSRIEKEINIVKNDKTTDNPAVAYKKYYLIRYLSKSDGTSLLYDVAPGSKVREDRIEADYNDFMYYANWQKGEK